MQPLAPPSAGVPDGVSGRLALFWFGGPNGNFKLRATLLLLHVHAALQGCLMLMQGEQAGRLMICNL